MLTAIWLWFSIIFTMLRSSLTLKEQNLKSCVAINATNSQWGDGLKCLVVWLTSMKVRLSRIQMPADNMKKPNIQAKMPTAQQQHWLRGECRLAIWGHTDTGQCQLQADPPENWHLYVKKLQKTLTFFHWQFCWKKRQFLWIKKKKVKF